MYGDGNFKYTPPSLHRSSSSKGISFILGAGPIESAVEDAKEKVKNDSDNEESSDEEQMEDIEEPEGILEFKPRQHMTCVNKLPKVGQYVNLNSYECYFAV